MQTHSLQDQTVVITGASSGIGRASARAFAAKGANVALAARRGELLDEVAAECRRLGGEALAIPTDVTDASAVRHLALEAERTFGRIDIWINNAGTGVFGPFLDADLALHRRTVEVNLIGAMNGAYAVLPIFQRQGSGILINNVSLAGWMPTPFAAAYTATKFGLRGFSASLRQELGDHQGIRVCAVFPAFIDTPGLEHSANVSGKQINPGPLVYAPEDVSDTFVSLAIQPRDEVAVGWPARIAQAAYALTPRATEHLAGAFVRRALSYANAAPRSEGSLLQPSQVGGSVSGGLRASKGLPSARKFERVASVVLAAGATAVALRWLARRQQS